MNLGDVIHRAVTDEMFVARLRKEPGAALATVGMAHDTEYIEAIQPLFQSSRGWKGLCSPSLTITTKTMTWTKLIPDFLPEVDTMWTGAKVKPTYAGAMYSVGEPKTPKVPEQSDSSLQQTLLGLCCEAAGGNAQRAKAITSAWGLLYAALHLFDDVEDQDLTDEPWARWGAGPAINIATGLLTSSSMALENLEQDTISAQAARAIRHDFYQTILTMCAGQHDDLTLVEPSIEQCWQIAAAKSGAFFALGCRTGARLAIDDPARIDWFGQIGQHIGMLVQISDDVQDLWAEGKRRSDLIAGQRWTLPIAYAMSNLPETERGRLQEYVRLAASDATAEAAARRLVIKSGAILYLVAEARRYVYKARCLLLQAVAPSAARDALLLLLATSVPMGMGGSGKDQNIRVRAL
jgi:geranylgeranyl pyrophosphate synthase